MTWFANCASGPRLLQLKMLEDSLEYTGGPGIAVLLSGDGRTGYLVGSGFHRTLERNARQGVAHRDALVGTFT